MKLEYPERISLARVPTPLEYTGNLSSRLGVRNHIYIKRDDLTGGCLSGNKVRKLEFLLAEARKEQAQVIITAGGVQSNHCRATAAACAKLGFRCHLILRGGASQPYDGNLLLDKLLGAEISFYPRDVFCSNYEQILQETVDFYHKQNLKTYYYPIGGSVPTGSWGYIKAFEEICTDVDELKRTKPELNNRKWYIVCADGSGGTHAGLLLGKYLLNRHDVDIIGFNVCDDPAYFYTAIKTIITGFREKYLADIVPEKIVPRIIGGYVGEGYAIPYDESINAIRLLARHEGIVLDPVYTGKAFYGMLDQLQKNFFDEDALIVFLHTGGLYSVFSYLDTFV